MARLKDWMEERYQRGYEDPEDDLVVCSEHVEDAYLKAQLREPDGGAVCSFCSDDAVMGAPFETLLGLVGDALHRFYEKAADAGVPWEGGWVWRVDDTYDVVWELCTDGGIEDDVAQRVVELFDDESWVPRYYPDDAPDLPLRQGWETFCRHVKHESRFLFRQPLPDVDDPYLTEEAPFDPHEALRAIARVIDESGLLTKLPAASALYRARATEFGKFSNITDFTSPPEALASQGRMNPAGISMFYGALDPETAAVEVYRGLPEAAVATFHAVRDLDVVDLRLIPRPSLFDPSTHPRDIHISRFLEGFIDDICKPIVHDDRVHREYVPTQALTECLRYRLLPAPAELDGILFPSSLRRGGTNAVVFVGQSGCLADNELDGNSRSEEQLLRCNTKEYVSYSFDPPRPIKARAHRFSAHEQRARRVSPAD